MIPTLRLRAVLSLAAAILLVASPPASLADETPHGGMLRYPDISADHIVFTYANDLWLAPRMGGVAVPLATPAGRETFGRFSPDGKTIAFMANYDGGSDLYTLPAGGGVPSRVTHHPAYEVLCDWTPDGQGLLFAASGIQGAPRLEKIFRVDAGGGLPEALPIPYGENAAPSADGEWIAYTPFNRDFRTWKRYRGGLASDIWLFNPETLESRRATDWEGSDSAPMWHAGALFYISDAGPAHRLNIWVADLETGEREQLTHFEDYDVKFPAMGPGPRGKGEIVFQLGSKLRVLDLGTGKVRSVEITIPGNKPTLRPILVDASENIANASISPRGKRVAFEARGDIWNVPAGGKGAPRNLTSTDGVAERDPSWSPDGRWIAYFSDATGEYELYLTQSDGRGETRQLTSGSETFYSSPRWSPDSKKLLFFDKATNIRLYDIESGETKLIDKDPWRAQAHTSWSHDSSWLAYTKGQDNGLWAIYLYEVAAGESHQVTSGRFFDTWPTFDRKGDYLYFASQRDFTGPVYDDMGSTFIYHETDQLFMVPLREDVGSPFLSEADDETWPDEKAEDASDDDGSDESDDDDSDDDEGSGDADEDSDSDDSGDEKAVSPFDPANMADDGAAEAAESSDEEDSDDSDEESGDDEGASEDESEEAEEEALKIDLEGFERRAMLLPVASGGFTSLSVSASDKLYYLRGGDLSIHSFNVYEDDPEESDFMASGGPFEFSADGKTLLIQRQGGYSVATSPNKAERVPTRGMTASINPREEWRQLYWDAWRIFRDYFYDPNMHGVDWKAEGERYEAMLGDAMTRSDLNYILGELISELNVGHAYVSGAGDVERSPGVGVGLLGADFEKGENGAYRIAKIIEGGAWDADARGPLSEPGVDVKVGDYLLAVNGAPVDADKDPWAALLGTPGQLVELTVSGKPEIDADARHVMVEPMHSERGLRYRDWVESMRAYVDEKSGGKIGYVYVPDTGQNGQNELFRQFYSEMEKPALLIDERWNGGGQIPWRFIELLDRPAFQYIPWRDGGDARQPRFSHQGPKAMLINGAAGSGGDEFPWLFRLKGLGKLVGTRTWGGLVGISGNPGLIDGGYLSVPLMAFYEMDGTWSVEGHGIDPDIEVLDDPSVRARGGDAQLDSAIAHLLEELEKNPYVAPKRPAYPDRSGMGIAEEDI